MKRSNIATIAAAAVVIAVILACSFALYGQDKDDGMRVFPTEMTDDDRAYKTAQEAIDEFSVVMERFDSIADDASSQSSDVADATGDAFKAYHKVVQQYEFVHLDYCFDPLGMNEQYVDWKSALDDAEDMFRSDIRDALDGDHSGTVADIVESFGKSTSEYLGYVDLTDEQRSLSQESTRLAAEYDAIMAKEYSWTDGDGNTWTIASAKESTTLTDEERTLICGNVYRLQMDDATEVYIDLVGVNNDLAETYGYHCYADMEYVDEYGREYTPEQAKTMIGNLGPAFDTWTYMKTVISEDDTLSSDTLGDLKDMGCDDIVEAISPVIEDLGPEYKAYLDWMVRNGTLYVESVDGQLDMGYSTDLPVNHGSLMYVMPKDWSTPMTVTHEFGHSANSGLNLSPSTCYDVSEIHSQGLEALVMVNAEKVFGDDGRALVAAQLSTMSGVVVTGALYSEFELWAYETEAEGTELTIEMLTSTYSEMAKEHGVTRDKYGLGAGYTWQNVHHLFDIPMYYVSYVTSAMNALELFVMASEDYGHAESVYLALTEQNDVHGYVQAVEMAGLSNMLDAENIRTVSEAVQKWVAENL